MNNTTTLPEYGAHANGNVAGIPHAETNFSQQQHGLPTSQQQHEFQPSQQQSGLQTTGTALGEPGAYASQNEKQNLGANGPDTAANAPHPKDPAHAAADMRPNGQLYATAVPLDRLEDSVAPVDCPSCRVRALTRIERHSGNTTHLWAALACFCCCLGCIPYLVPAAKDVEHYCGHCGVQLAIWKRSGRTSVKAFA